MKADVIASLLGALAGIGVITGALDLRVGTLTNPQPGSLPFVAGAALLVLSATLMMQAWSGQGTGGEDLGDLRRPALVVAAMGLYALMFDPLGYVLTTTLIAGVLLRVLGVASWRAVAVTSLLLSAATYVLFARVLGVELPAGVLEFLG